MLENNGYLMEVFILSDPRSTQVPLLHAIILFMPEMYANKHSVPAKLM